MRRADRLFQIVQYLRGGRLVTAAQLAEKLEVTPRTIYRDVADLIGSGVPIEGPSENIMKFTVSTVRSKQTNTANSRVVAAKATNIRACANSRNFCELFSLHIAYRVR